MHKGMKRFPKNLLKHLFSRNVLKSLAISIALIIIGYFSNNWPLFTGENLSLYTRMEFIRNLFDSKEDDFSGAFFVNTSMDKQLIDVYEDGYQVGKKYLHTNLHSSIDQMDAVLYDLKNDIYETLQQLKKLSKKDFLL